MAKFSKKQLEELLKTIFFADLNIQQYADSKKVTTDAVYKELKSLRDALCIISSGCYNGSVSKLPDILRMASDDNVENFLAVKQDLSNPLKNREALSYAFLLKYLQLVGENSEKGSDVAGILRKMEFPDSQNYLISDRMLSDYLTYLSDKGYLLKAKEQRKYYYKLQDFLQKLGEEALQELAAVLWHAANAEIIPSVYLSTYRVVKNELNKRMEGQSIYRAGYKYAYLGRVLSDYYVLLADAAHREKRWQEICLDSAKNDRVHAADTAWNVKKFVAYPLDVFFEDIIGRWYIVYYVKSIMADGEDEKMPSGSVLPVSVDSIEDMITLDEILDECLWQKIEADYRERSNCAWKASAAATVEVVINFYYEDEQRGYNFIRTRVEREKRHGVIKNLSDGVFQLRIKVKGTEEIKPWIFSFGSSAEVLQPRELREFMRDAWSEAAERYGCGNG